MASEMLRNQLLVLTLIIKTIMPVVRKYKVFALISLKAYQ